MTQRRAEAAPQQQTPVIARFESTLTRFMIGLNFKRKRLSTTTTTTCRNLVWTYIEATEMRATNALICAQLIALLHSTFVFILKTASSLSYTRVSRRAHAYKKKKRKGINCALLRHIDYRVKLTCEIA